MLPMFAHQQVTSDLLVARNGALVLNDPGTGKTRSVLEAFRTRKELGQLDKLLVLAPLSILEPAWGGDIRKWTPDLTYQVVTARSKWKGFAEPADVYITNHDAVKWMIKDWDNKGFRWALCVDEFTVYKHRTSQRSKAVGTLAKHFDAVWMLSGTPNSNTVTDIWYPAYLVDQGERLGRSFWGFRAQVCTPVQVGPNPNMVEWRDKPHANEIIADRLKDISVRFKLEDCVDLPENSVHTLTVGMNPRLRKQYEQMRDNAMLELAENDNISAIHAGVVAQKLLQICAGAVYNADGEYRVLGDDRTELVMDLIEERHDPVLVAFNWQHQKDLLVAAATKRKIPYAVIDGTVPAKDRNLYVELFQAGKLKVIFAHPQSAGHGLTLTRGSTTIWASPTYNAEFFQQFNRRVYRTSQTKRTETILIAAEDTVEQRVYEKLNGKVERMTDLLNLFQELAA